MLRPASDYGAARKAGMGKRGYGTTGLAGGTSNIQHRTSNIQWSGRGEDRGERGAGRVALVQLRLRRTDQGNRFALISAVNAEVLAVHRNNTVSGKEFAQANQAQIGQIGMTVGVA